MQVKLLPRRPFSFVSWNAIGTKNQPFRAALRENIESRPFVEININYIWNELRKALKAKSESANAKDLAQAEERIARWRNVLSGVQSGDLKIGSRKPTTYPPWVTLEVVRGGFTTGKAVASTPFSEDERECLGALAPDAPSSRAALFSALLSDEGLGMLRKFFESRMYKIEHPEDAALFFVAWLHENERLEGAASILAEISKYAPELRFLPKRAAAPVQKTTHFHRFSSNDVRLRLSAYKVNRRIETQREALQIWIPFTDQLVALWLELFGDDAAKPDGQIEPAQSWKDAAADLVNEYEKLKNKHTLCSRHHNRKENLQLLLAATRDLLSGGKTQGNLNRARHAVRCYVTAHGKPGEDRFIAARKEHAKVASFPGHDQIADALACRLPESDDGLSNIEELLSPVRLEGRDGIPAGDTPVPKRLCEIVNLALKAPFPELIKRGIAPSAEILAELAPQLTALEISRAYADENLSLLIMETYKAFSRRRSLLLLDLSSQIRFDELPWVEAVKSDRQNTEHHVAVALGLAQYAIDFFPGTILPNSLIGQFNSLYEFAVKKRPYLAELAADIFMGRFDPKYDDATLAAAALLRGSLYERYYDLDYAKFIERLPAFNLSSEAKRHNLSLLEQVVSEYVDKNEPHCDHHVVRNGMLLECAQIHTTHNLATLVAENVKPSQPYEKLALMAFEHSLLLVKRSIKSKAIGGNYLRAIKNAAYAWRQALFFLSISPKESVDTTISRAKESSLRLLGEDITAKLFERLEITARGKSPDSKTGPFLGWTFGPHPLLVT